MLFGSCLQGGNALPLQLHRKSRRIPNGSPSHCILCVDVCSEAPPHPWPFVFKHSGSRTHLTAQHAFLFVCLCVCLSVCGDCSLMQHIETQASDSLPEDIPVESILRCKRLVLAAMLQQITRTPLHCFLPPTHHTRAPTTTPIRRLEEAAKTLPYKIKEQEERQCKPGFQCSTSGSCDALQEANKNKHTTARTTQTTHCSTQSRAHIHTHTHTLVPSCLRARQGVLRYSSSMGGNDGAASGSSSGSTAWDRGWPMPLEIMDRQPKTKKKLW